MGLVEAIDKALNLVEEGCDKQPSHGFVYYIDPNEAGDVQEAKRVQSEIEKLSQTQQQEVQRQVRSVVQDELRREFAQVPDYMVDHWEDYVES